jgi:hypothetical protein
MSTRTSQVSSAQLRIPVAKSPTGGSNTTSFPAEVGKHLMKTKICSLYLNGKCHYGAARCFYAHSKDELRDQPRLEKTSLCMELKRSGKCAQGEHCRYAHSVEEMTKSSKRVSCLWFSNGHCSHGSGCRFAHEDTISSLAPQPSTPVMYRRGASSTSTSASSTASVSPPKSPCTSLLDILGLEESSSCSVCGAVGLTCICRVFEECSELLRLL